MCTSFVTPLTIIVERTGSPTYERDIFLRQGTHRWRLDPQAEIQAAIAGTLISRNDCVVNFVEGLVAAGHVVLVRDRRFYKYQREDLHWKCSWINSPYFLLGFAWGKGQWDQLRAALVSSIVPQARLRVLEATCQHLIENRWDPRISLRVPLG